MADKNPWQDILDNETIPDTLEIELGEGRKLKLGDLRGQYKDQVANLTKGFQKLSAQEKDLKVREEALARTLDDTRRAAPAVPSLDDDDYPVTRKEARQLIQMQQQALFERDKELHKERYLRQLQELRRDEPDLDAKALLDFAMQHQLTDLNLAHREMTRDRDIERAKKSEYERGLEEGKKTAQTPFVPSGLRPIVHRPAAETPKSADDLVSKAAADPDIIRSFAEGMIPGAGA